MKKNNEYRQDPLYRAINMSEEIRYVEGKFKEIIDKLKGINNLGILPEVYEMARYPKYEHHLGTVYQVNQFIEYTGLNQEYQIPLKIAALFLHMGHMPFTYSTERAFLLTSVLEKGDNNKVSKYIDNKLDYIFDELNLSKEKRKKHRKKLFSLENHTEFYKYLSCYIFLDNWRNIKGKFNLTDEDKKVIVNNMIDQNSDGYTFLKLADKADFVQRDALYFGTVRLDISPKHLYGQGNINNKNESMFSVNEEELIDNNLKYLTERFYENKDTKWFIKLYEKIVASLILSKRFKLEYLEKFDDTQFKHLITENIETPNIDKVDLPRNWVNKAKNLFEGNINFSSLFEIENLFFEEEKDIVDLEYELMQKDESERGLLKYPFKKGVLLDINYIEKTRFPFQSDYRCFSVNVYQDKDNKNFLSLMKVISQLTIYCSISDISNIRKGLSEQFSWTGYSRIDTNVTEIIAEVIEKIENDNEEYKKGDFVKKFLKDLTSIKSFEDLWNNFENRVFWFSSIQQEINNNNQNLSKIYEVFAHGIISLPIRLFQYKTNKSYIEMIYNKLLEMIKKDCSNEKKGYLYETLWYLNKMKEKESKFKFLINGMVVVDSESSINRKDINEFDIIELKINDNSIPECWIYACTIKDNYRGDNKDQLEQLAKNIHNIYPDLKVRTRYIIPENKNTGDWAPKEVQTGVGTWN